MYSLHSELNSRFNIWKENHEFILHHNSLFQQGIYKFKVAHNKYSDLSSQEFLSIKGFNTNQNYQNNNSSNFDLQSSNISSSIDWRTKGCLNPIQDQGQCGSCYAFSAACGIESQFFLKTGKLLKLSGLKNSCFKLFFPMTLN